MKRLLFGGQWGLIFSVVGLALILIPVSAKQNPEGEPLVQKVKVSIDRAIKFLRAQENGRGNWEVDGESAARKGGWTSLAMLALLNSGIKPEDPMILRGLEFLRGIKPEQTYTVGLQTMVLVQAAQPQDKPLIERNVKWLLDSRIPGKGGRPGGWGYGSGLGTADNSNTQYALLGIHEGIRAGVKVPEQTLRDLQNDVLSNQQGDGGWSYRNEPFTTLTMTTAGLCNLIITGMDLQQGKQKIKPDGSAEDCGVYEENAALRRAVRWLGDNFPAKIRNTGDAMRTLRHPFYALYGIERAGRLTGQRYFAGHDWYRVGSDFLVSIQDADGSFGGGRGGMGGLDSWPVVATSFSLLFLAKGRTPVLVSKLAHNGELSWNRKRSDMRNLVEFTSRNVFEGLPLAWQVFDTSKVDMETKDGIRAVAGDLLQSPIVWFNGHDRVPGGSQVNLLKEYVSNGGFIVAEACCGSPQFDAEFRRLVKELFPENELIRLPDGHPIWTASGKFLVDPAEFPLYGISQGCKTVLVYSEKPIAGYWEENRFTAGRGREAFRLGANIIAYATGMEAPKPRLTEAEVFKPEDRTQVRRGFLRVGQIKHGGDWQPAPRAMNSLMEKARKDGLDVVLQPKPVSLADPNLFDFKFLYLHGRTPFQFPSENLKQLKFVLDNGGTLLSDACCGAKPFDQSFRSMVKDLFADSPAGSKPKLEPIPPGDELYSADLNGKLINQIRLRRESQAGQPTDAEYKLAQPRLEGVKIQGRWAIIYSPYDLGCALEKNKGSDCVGYDHDSAVLLAKAVLFYSLRR